MTTARANVTNQNSNPLVGLAGVCIFAFLTLVSISIVFIYCSEFISINDANKSRILEVYLFTIIIGWFSFTASDDPLDFLLFGSITGLSYTVLIGMLQGWHPGLFWVGLVVFLTFSMVVVFSSVNPKGIWNQAFVGVYVIWIITGIFFLLGSSRLFKYAEPALKISAMHFLLDLRYLTTASVAVVFVGKSVSDAFRQGAPYIPSLPDFDIPKPGDSFISVIFSPIVIVLNTILLVVQKITNAVWQVVATVGSYLIRIGVNLAKHVLDIVLNGDIWISILKLAGTFLILLFIASLVGYIGPTISAQILREWWPYEVSIGNLKELLALAGSFLLVLILINTICRVWSLVEVPLPKSAFAAAMLMVAWALSGLICFGVSRVELIKLRGFHSMGLYTLLFLLFIGSVFIFQLCFHLGGKLRRAEPSAQPHMGTWAIGSVTIFLLLTSSLFWWLPSRKLDVEPTRVEANTITEEQQKEERRRRREETKKDFLERGKREAKDVWQTAKILNRTGTVIDVRASNDSGRTWRPYRLEPNGGIVLSGRNGDLIVQWDSDPSSRISNKRQNLVSEVYFDHRPTAEEETKGPLNFFSSNGSVIDLGWND